MQKHLRKSLPMLFQITVSINFTYEKRVRIYNVIYLPEESDLMALFLFVARHSKLWIIEIIFILIKTTCTIKSPLFTLSNILPTSCYATSIIFTGTNINWMLANNFDCNAPVIKKKSSYYFHKSYQPVFAKLNVSVLYKRCWKRTRWPTYGNRY